MSSVEQSKGWTTSAELTFIASMADSHDSIDLLSGYLSGMRKRHNFGHIDVATCTRVAQQYLDEQIAALRTRRAA